MTQRKDTSAVELAFDKANNSEPSSRSIPPEVAPAIPVALPLLKEALDAFRKNPFRSDRYAAVESLFRDLERDNQVVRIANAGIKQDYLAQRVTLAAVQAERDRLAKDYDTLRQAINDNSGECSPGCNSYGHTENCEYVDDAATMRIQQEKIDALRSELSSLRSLQLTPREAERTAVAVEAYANQLEDNPLNSTYDLYHAIAEKLRKLAEPNPEAPIV